MWGQNTFGLPLVLAGLLCFGTPISAKTGFLRRDALTAAGCALNTRTPNPLNRQTFYHCTPTGFNLMRCPETMVFDATSSTCVKDDTDTTTPPPQTIIDIYVPDCTKATDGAFFPAYCDCTKYWVCDHNDAILFSCGEGTQWSQEYMTCVYPEDANCEVDQHDECQEGDIKRNFK